MYTSSEYHRISVRGRINELNEIYKNMLWMSPNTYTVWGDMISKALKYCSHLGDDLIYLLSMVTAMKKKQIRISEQFCSITSFYNNILSDCIVYSWKRQKWKRKYVLGIYLTTFVLSFSMYQYNNCLSNIFFHW